MHNPDCFVASVDISLSKKMKNDLASQGFSLSAPPHTAFSAKKPGICCTLYLSGKLTVQGKDKQEFIEFYLEPHILHALSYTHPEIEGTNLTSRIGVDEAGKGDYFGPLCISGVQADEVGIRKLLSLRVRDSKRIADAEIQRLAQQIRVAVPSTIIQIFPEKYNELYQSFRNLNRLLAWGHATAIADMYQKTGCHSATIDQFGPTHLVEHALKQKHISIDLTQQHHGESADPVIAAASILARAAFLHGLAVLEEEFGMSLPKGASAAVIIAGRSFVQAQGEQALHRVAKWHFRTTEAVLCKHG